MLKWFFSLTRQWCSEGRALVSFIFLALTLSAVPDLWQDVSKYLQENKPLDGWLDEHMKKRLQ